MNSMFRFIILITIGLIVSSVKAQEVGSYGIITYQSEAFSKDRTESNATDRYMPFTEVLENGAKIDYLINMENYTAKVTGGNANGADKFAIPPIVCIDDMIYPVIEIEEFAFYSVNDEEQPLKGVKYLVVGDWVKKVGEGCFKHARDLETVKISTPLENISSTMFADCPKLQTVIIPDDSHLQSIGSSAFWNCSSLSEFTIPEKVETINEAPWSNCGSLKCLKVAERNHNFRVEDGVLYNNRNHTLIQYPGGKRDKVYKVAIGTVGIEKAAFYGNSYIEEVIFPASLEYIHHFAFYGCSSLREVEFNSCDVILGSRTFQKCPNLHEMVVYGFTRYIADEPAEPECNFEGNNTFDPFFEVFYIADLPGMVLPKSKKGILHAVYSHVAAMSGFTTGDMKKIKKQRFPEFLGKGHYAVYRDASPKKDVLRALEQIPDEYLVYDSVNKYNETERFYLIPDKKNTRSLYFFGGNDGDDLVVIYYEKGNLSKIQEMVENLNKNKK